MLLGDPGAGKTTVFKEEKRALGEDAWIGTVDDFLLPREPPSEWDGRTFFIDGLDEVRAGGGDPRSPFERIRRRLLELGKPRFRLSCREADWLGENDRRNLAKVSPEETVTVLRLDPLSDPDIRAILDDRPDVPDSSGFIWKARERGIGGLLTNPQALTLLATVVGGGDRWPRSRLDTFEKACRRLVREHNDEHRVSSGAWSTCSTDDLLDAAGHLCAIHLLTGTEGFSVPCAEGDDRYLGLHRCDYDPPEMLRHILGTMLFKGTSDHRFAPIHGHVAAYLGARHLSRRIEEGLPARRVLALMTGGDGTVVTQLRGLAAWLAAQCSKARSNLIDGDPVGVGLYGDVELFDLREKQALLEALAQGASGHGLEYGVIVGLGGLVVPGMEPAFESVLAHGDRGPSDQILADFGLRILCQGGSLPRLSETLLGVVRDEKWWSSVRTAALEAFAQGCPTEHRTDRLRALLEEVRGGVVTDVDDELRGTLLTLLYPRHLSVSELWACFSDEYDPHLYGAYRRFWEELAKMSPDDHLAEHLDYLSQGPPHGHGDDGGDGRPSATLVHTDPFRRLRLALVERGLSRHGDELMDNGDIARLYDWLGAASAKDGDGWDTTKKSIVAIRSWLEARPSVQKAILNEGLRRCSDAEKVEKCALGVSEHLYRCRLPRDYGVWCLDRAVAMAFDAPDLSDYLLTQAYRSIGNHRFNEGLSLELVREATKDCERLRVLLARLTSPQPPSDLDEWREQEERYRADRAKEKEKKREKELDYLRSQTTPLLENRAPPGLLDQLAHIYLGGFSEIDRDERAGLKTIEDRWEDQQDIVDAVLAGLRGVLSRSDIPSVKEIAQAHREGRRYPLLLALPFLAGLAERERVGQPIPFAQPGDADGPVQVNEQRGGCEGEADDLARVAVAFFLVTIPRRYLPGWYRKLVRERPELIADVQVRVASAALKGTRFVDCKLSELARDPDYAEVARRSALPLLRGFPVRCGRDRAQQLGYLLHAALLNSDEDALRRLIDAKLSRSSMSVWQRTNWLAAGLFVSPDAYVGRLWEYVRRHEHRLAELARFVLGSKSLKDLPEETIAHLLRLLGSSAQPERYRGAPNRVVVRDVPQRARFVSGLIGRLAASHSSEAADLLRGLVQDETLSNWNEELLRAREAQSVLRRDHGYQHPSIEEVRGTLRGGRPANVADLAALVVDCLEGLAVEINQGDADGWEPFWNQDGYGHGTKPKRENSCRNVIAKELQLRLPSSVETSIEAHHARENKSDLRASFLTPAGERLRVPVEIKKNDHRDLWTAIDSQLVRKYTINPAAGGHGIYLVLWFGKKYTQRPPEGERPDSPRKLESRLRETLSGDQTRKISVCVLDVSGDRPVTQPRTR